jgi:hypothetical protein
MSDTADPPSIENFKRSGPHFTDRSTSTGGPTAADEAVR